MCGILSLLNVSNLNKLIIKNFEKGKNRGPENSNIECFFKSIVMGFHRLAINGLNEKDNQPLNISNCVLICNGEIYNYNYLYSQINIDRFSENDCEIIIHLYKKFGIEETLNLLDGVFAFVLLDIEKKLLFVARDAFGVRPLFTFKKQKHYGFSSEMKMIVDFEPENISLFTPGTFSKFKYEENLWKPELTNVKFANINNGIDYTIETEKDAMKKIKLALENAVKKRVGATERPIACLLSGGLDSSLITSLVQKYYTSELETYSIGLEGSEDLKYAKIVADYLNTKHTEIIVTEKEFLEAIPKTIEAIESYDTTTVRASVGNFLVSEYIKKNSKAKVIFNGDGSDEVCGGYLYFHAAPNAFDFDKECRRLLKDIHAFDVLRSDRSISSNGLEPRTPFLDRNFVQTYLSIPAHLRCHNIEKKCEKYLLRSAFKDSKLLPDNILFRKKEAFSDGVSDLKRSWYQIIQEHIKTNRRIQQTIKTPFISLWNIQSLTDEQKYYRKIFEHYYKEYSNVIPYFWMPKFIKATDASARTLDLY